MKKTILKSFFAIFAIATLLLSCSNDDDSSKPTPSSREIKYEVTGNATGNFEATYTSATGSITTEQFTSLPWSKNLTVQNQVSGVTLMVSVTGATPSKTITGKIYVGNSVKSEGTQAVLNNGIAVLALPTYVFP